MGEGCGCEYCGVLEVLVRQLAGLLDKNGAGTAYSNDKCV